MLDELQCLTIGGSAANEVVNDAKGQILLCVIKHLEQCLVRRLGLGEYSTIVLAIGDACKFSSLVQCSVEVAQLIDKAIVDGIRTCPHTTASDCLDAVLLHATPRPSAQRLVKMS